MKKRLPPETYAAILGQVVSGLISTGKYHDQETREFEPKDRSGIHLRRCVEDAEGLMDDIEESWNTHMRMIEDEKSEKRGNEAVLWNSMNA
jgi:hypothetical protein